MDRWASFDCYGTLIDWERGLRDAFGALWPAGDRNRLLAALTELRNRGWKLAILSNTDPDLLASSGQAIGISFDLLITAREAGSYKPDPGHWERFFSTSRSDREHHVHVAASLFHDIAPAERLGLRAVWINRRSESSDLPRAAELPDLAGLPDTLARLVD